jgi:WD40 repeat protein
MEINFNKPVNNPNQNFFTKLPNKLIVANIFKYFSEKSELCELSLVCKRWYHLSSANLLWKPHFKEKFPDSFKHLIDEPVLSNHFEKGYRELFGQYAKIDRNISRKSCVNDTFVEAHQITCLKAFKGKILKDFFGVDNPNHLRIHQEKAYLVTEDEGIDAEISIFDLKEKEKKVLGKITFNGLVEDDKLITITIDKSKNHLYAAFYNDDEERQDVVKVIDLDKFQEIRSFCLNGVQKMHIHADKLIVANYNILKIWDIKGAPELLTTLQDNSFFTCFKLHDNKLFYSKGSTGGKILVWDLVEQKACNWEFPHSEAGKLTCLQIYDHKLFAGFKIDSENQMINCESSSCVIVWNLKTRKRMTKFLDEGVLGQMLFNNGRLITAMEDSVEVNLRDFRPLKTTQVLEDSKPTITEKPPITEPKSKKRKRRFSK